MEPYIPTFFKTNSLFASDVGIEINPDAHIIMAPNIGSYVGGDITAGTLVSMIWNRPEFSLFIDLGTNGELVFGNSDFIDEAVHVPQVLPLRVEISAAVCVLQTVLLRHVPLIKKLWSRHIRL